MNVVTDRHRTGAAAELIRKIEAETDVSVLNAMQQACKDRGEDLTVQEIHAFARRRAELWKAKAR